MKNLPDPTGTPKRGWGFNFSPSRRNWLRSVLDAGRKVTIGGVLFIVEEWNIGLVQQAAFAGLRNLRLFRSKVDELPPAISPLELKYGYDRVAGWRSSLGSNDYHVSPVTQWERVSIPGLITLPPMYHRPQQAGLAISDADGNEFYRFSDPYKVYTDFSQIPPLLVKTLALVEDRTLLAESALPTENLAIDYRRLTRAIGENISKAVGLREAASGGSTIPIQVIKQEAFPGGETKSSKDKLGQIFVASLRVTDGDTGTNIENVRREFVKYMNIVSLGSHPRTGEIRGWHDAMAVWFGNTNFNELLSGDLSKPEAALAYRQALTLVMAVQKPDELLRSRAGWNAGQQRADNFLSNVLVSKGIITPAFAARVRAVKISYDDIGKKPVLPQVRPSEKSTRTAKLDLLRQLGIGGKTAKYVLDHAQLSAVSTLYTDIDHEISAFLRELNKPEFARKHGLLGSKLLNESNAQRVRYGLMVQEVTDDGRAHVRVKTDTYRGALDLNASGKMNLGSTQKLVMAWTYNVMVGRLFDDFSKKTADELLIESLRPHDDLTLWAISWLQGTPVMERTKINMLRAGAARTYASAPQTFFTGEGLWSPANFEPRTENHLHLEMQQAVWRSTNLSSARFTRDVQDCVKWHILGFDRRIMDFDEQDETVVAERRKHVEDFARYEGGVYQSRAFVAMQGRSPEAVLRLLTEQSTRKRGTPAALMATYLSVYPQAGFEKTLEFATANCTRVCDRSTSALQTVFDSIKTMDLNDRGYTAGVNPLWLRQAELRAANPAITLKDSLEATQQDRLDVYKWLIQARHPRMQQRALNIMTDQAAWKWIEGLWQTSFGYNYTLKATLANVLGGAVTNPQLLTNFMNMLLADGKRPRQTNFTSFEFGKGTPFETTATASPVKLEQVCDPLVAAFTVEIARGNIEYEHGTGKRLKGKIKLRDGTILPSGGKTGTNGETETQSTRIAAYVINLGPRLSLAAMVYLDSGTASDRFTSGVVVRMVEAMLQDNGPLQKLIDRVYGEKATSELTAAFNPVARVLRAQNKQIPFRSPIAPEPSAMWSILRKTDPAPQKEPLFPLHDLFEEAPDWWDISPVQKEQALPSAAPFSAPRSMMSGGQPRP